MKPHILLLALTILLGSSCEDDDTKLACSVVNPATDLEWLAAKIQEMQTSSISQYSYVTQGKFKFMTVFVFRDCCPYCNTVVSVYNCSGELVGMLGRGDNYIDPSDINDEVIIWKPDNFECLFM